MPRKPEPAAKVRARRAKADALLREKGYTKVCVWVPVENAAEVRALAQRLKESS